MGHRSREEFSVYCEMLGLHLSFTITVILGVVWSGVKSQQSEDDHLIDKNVGVPYIIATVVIILIICCIFVIILIILIVCILRQKRQHHLNNDQRHNSTHFCLSNNEAMDQKTSSNSADRINSTFDTVRLDPPVEKNVSCDGTINMQAISFADSDNTQHSTAGTADAAKVLVEIVIPFSHDVPTETCLNKNDETHKSTALDHVPMDSNTDEPKETNKVQKDADSSTGDVNDVLCQSDAVTMDRQRMCGSTLQDCNDPTSTTNTDETHSFLNDSCYVNEGADHDIAPSSPGNSLSSPTNPPYSPNAQSADLVAIFIPYDDNSMVTIAEDQGKPDSVHNSLLRGTAAVHNAQTENADCVKEVEPSDSEQLQIHAPTMQIISSSKEAVEVHSLSDGTIEIPDTDTMPTKKLSTVISSLDDTSVAQKKSQPEAHSVAIDIPPAGSGAVPTLAKDTGHDQYVNPSCDESITLQRNPAYVTIGDERSSIGTIDEVVELQRNPAYIPINHASSETQWYEVIPCTTALTASTSSNISTSDATIKMVKNPAYHTININRAKSPLHSTK